MPLRRSDRALRRLVAELATTTPEDVQAILEGLDKPQREEVRALLAAYLGEPSTPMKAPEPAAIPTSKLVGLSPWLAAPKRSWCARMYGNCRFASLTG